MDRVHRVASSLLLLAALFASCGQASASWSRNNVGEVNKAQQISAEGKAQLHAYLDIGELPDLQHPDFSNTRAEAKEFYESVADSLPWITDRRPTAQACALIQTLEQAETEGLNPLDYDGPRWPARLAVLDSGRAPEAALIRFDLGLTVSAMRYLSDLHRGRMNPRQLHFDLTIDNKNFDLSELLLRDVINATNMEQVMRGVEPPFPQYRQTVEALQTYMKLAREDDGELLPLPAKPLKRGAVYSGVPRLARLLRLLGDLPAGTPPAADQLYNGPLVTAVKHYQQRHGLEPNGIPDAHTVNELNTPLSQRVLQLKLTLERWRWLPHDFERPPLVVNIPEFRLYVANDEHLPAFSMKVVVGRSYKNQTPVFATELKSLLFRPYWNVPLSIQRKELLPELKKDANYLRKHDYEVVDANQTVVSEGDVSAEMMKQLYSGKLAIRQRPGAENSLGLIKFDMPNGYDVYMHSTPATQLFSRSRRDFSHGCIRVEDPVKLAEWVLQDKPEWDATSILAAMHGDDTIRVNISKPFPVLILYGTATVAASGEIDFFDDIYGHDAELEQALAKGYPYSSEQ